MMAGGWDSLATHLSQNVGDESKTSWVTSSLSSSSRIRARTSRTSGRSFWYRSKRVQLRSTSGGPVNQAVSLSSASGSFRTLEGVAPFLEPPAVVSWLCFRCPRGSLTLRLRGGGTSSAVVSSAWPESVSEAMLLCPGTRREDSEAQGCVPLISRPPVRVLHPVAPAE